MLIYINNPLHLQTDVVDTPKVAEVVVEETKPVDTTDAKAPAAEVTKSEEKPAATEEKKE